MVYEDFHLTYDGTEAPQDRQNILNEVGSCTRDDRKPADEFLRGDSACSIAAKRRIRVHDSKPDRLLPTSSPEQAEGRASAFGFEIIPGFSVALDMTSMPLLTSLSGVSLLNSKDDGRVQSCIDITNSPHLADPDLIGDYDLRHGKKDLVLPSVERLEFQSVALIGVRIDPVLLSFVKCSDPPLVHLEIFRPDAEQGQLVSMLDLLPLLQRLRVSSCQEAE